jgi:hypothetical protein
MLQPPEQGGELQVWDRLYEGEAEVDPEEHAEHAERGMRSVLCSYQAGDLVVIDSHRLHMIQPFSGAVDRISATIHAVYVDEPPPEAQESGGGPSMSTEGGHWQVWF